MTPEEAERKADEPGHGPGWRIFWHAASLLWRRKKTPPNGVSLMGRLGDVVGTVAFNAFVASVVAMLFITAAGIIGVAVKFFRWAWEV